MDCEDLDMEIVEPEDGEDCMSNEGDSDSDESENNKKQKAPKTVYLPSNPLEKDEELICDESAYLMLHQASTVAPCLSFDIIQDDLGNKREQFPLTAYIVAGTQASSTHVNNLIVMKMSNLHKTQNGDDDEELEDDEDEVVNIASRNPQMTCSLIKHQGCVNRIRARRLGSKVYAASWSELGRVNVWNLSTQLEALEDEQLLNQYNAKSLNESSRPVYTYSGHQMEGYAIDWSSCADGVLATGDCKRDIHIWAPVEDGSWKIDQRPLIGHSASVEDIQWSPNERSVLASGSADKSVRIWDCRAAPQKACMLKCEDAHQSDVNVISWNRSEPFIASGGDDGLLHIWDLRQFQTKKPIATFKHHTNHITTVEWNPCEATVLASGGDDDQIALWDLAVEKDTDEEHGQSQTENDEELNKLPPQLLFIHQGQKEIKELHWHPQLPGVIISTALSGFNIFRTISV